MTRFFICVIGKGSQNHWEKQDTEEEKFELTLGDTTYRGNVSASWFTPYDLLSRKLSGEKGFHLTIFHEGDPEPVIHGDPPENTAIQLMRAYRYKGVNPALKDQFIEKSALDLPWWALLIGLAVFIVAFLVIATKQGWLLDVFKGQPKPEKGALFMALMEVFR
jgi:hypothetical protein